MSMTLNWLIMHIQYDVVCSCQCGSVTFPLSLKYPEAGGAHLSLRSVGAAVLGLLAGAPMAALNAALWTPEARKRFPALEDMHKAECDPLDALFEGMTPAQVCLLLCT